jgi:hypothetical protein
MSRLDDDLRNALQHKEPPPGFLERALAGADAAPQPFWKPVYRRRCLRWAVAGAFCMLLMIAGIEYKRALEERARGEAAKTQLIQALRIAGDKLQFAQAKVREIGIPSIPQGEPKEY